MKKTFLVAVFSIVSLIFQSSLAFAGDVPAFGFAVVKDSNYINGELYYELKPGQTVSGSFIAQNLDDEAVEEFKPEVAADNNDKHPDSLGGVPADWVDMVENFSLLPGQTQVFDFQLTIPEGSTPGIYTSLLQIVLTNYSIGGGSVSFHLAVADEFVVKVLEPDPILPAIPITGKSYKLNENYQSGIGISWSNLAGLGTTFEKYHIKFKKGHYDSFDGIITAKSYIGWNYYNLFKLEPGTEWTFQVVPVKKVNGQYVEAGIASNLLHCTVSDKSLVEAVLCQ